VTTTQCDYTGLIEYAWCRPLYSTIGQTAMNNITVIVIACNPGGPPSADTQLVGMQAEELLQQQVVIELELGGAHAITRHKHHLLRVVGALVHRSQLVPLQHFGREVLDQIRMSGERVGPVQKDDARVHERDAGAPGVTCDLFGCLSCKRTFI